MILGPRIVYSVDYCALLERRPDASGRGYYASIERIVPGTEAQGWVNGRWYRAHRIEDYSIAQGWQVTVALHSAWRFYEAWTGRVVEERRIGCDGVVDAVFADRDREWLLSYGRQLLDDAVRRGEILPHVLDLAAPFQVAFSAWTATRPWAMLTARPGGGKTLSALLALSSRPLATTLVVCPAAARKEWRVGGNRARRMPSSVERFTTMETHVVLPVGERRKGYEEMDAYLKRVEEEGKRQVVVVGMESLPDHMNEVKALAPSVLIIDEIHKLGDNHRHDVTVGEDGTPSFHAAKSEAGGVRRSVAAMQVSRLSSLKLRVGLSGTPLDDGKTRRLWAPLDLLSPGGFGAFGSAYKHRFCGLRIDEGGFPDDSASTHVVDDLRPRCAFLLFDVPRSESHGARKLRLEVDYLDASRLGKPDAMVREMQKLSREAAKGGVASKMAMREANLAYACSMKKPAVLSRSKEFLESNMKVMIFVSRRAMADAWGDVLRKTGAEGWVAHGDMGSAECDRLVEMYATAAGAAWLVGTWDAIGESKNGMQGTHLGVVAQLPVKPSQWIQGIGRWDRMDGVGTIVWVPVAEGTQDDKEIARLVRKFGPITQFLESPELREAGDALEALDDESLQESIVQKLRRGGIREEEDEP